MNIKLWPSGHSHDYTRVFLFKNRRDAGRNEKPAMRILKRLESVSSGGSPSPIWMGGACIVLDELDYGDRADRVARKVDSEMDDLGATVLPYGISLAIRLPRMEEIPLLNREEIEFAKFAKSVALEALDGEEARLIDGSHFLLESNQIRLYDHDPRRECSIDPQKLEALEVWLLFAGGRRTLLSRMVESETRHVKG